MNSFFTSKGKPVFVLGGQSHNSSTYSPSDLGVFWKALDALRANTAEIPVYWEAIEPEEGKFDFSSVDMLFKEARSHGKYLILLWFGTWKNGSMRYTPSWVKSNPGRFKRVISHDGNSLFVLSSHCEENLKADCRAFSALMKHLKTINSDETLLAVQVQNEPGIAGRSYRDFGQEAERDYQAPVPQGLLDRIALHPDDYLYKQWEKKGCKRGVSWEETFGVKEGSENLSAYSIASYINEVAKAGKAEYQIPLLVNIAFDGYHTGWNLPGINYTGGGPIPRLYHIWKYGAPQIDLLAPDIYHNTLKLYTWICQRYSNEENALFIPESGSRGGGNTKNMFYAIGTYGAIGYAVFGIEGILDKNGQPRPQSQDLINSYHSLEAALPLLVKYRQSGKVHTVVEEEFEGGYFFDTEKYIVKVNYLKDGYSNFIHRALESEPSRGRGLIIQASPMEFFLLGSDFTVFFAQKDDIFYSEDRLTYHMPYLSVEEGRFDASGEWQTSRIRTGDECDHGIWVYPENGVVRVVLCE
ncbi:MAG: DUF5597 domain-containing protein [Treponema sp.]|nr:DUF5597 domain-containing protein [Treponema sp.]